MSFLALPDGIPDFSQAVISLWFRVPQTSIDAVTGGDILSGVVPLVTFGRPQIFKNYSPNVTDIAVWHYTPDEGTHPIFAISSWYVESESPVDPCYIGLVRSGDVVHLGFNLQMADTAILTSAVWLRTQWDIFSQDQVHPEPITPGDGWMGFGQPQAWARATIADASYFRNETPEWFYVETAQPITAEHWHHLLLSFDVGGAVSVGQPHASSLCRMWYALDDVDYRGAANLGPFRDADDGLDDNAILTSTVYRRSGGSPDPELFFNQYVPAASGTASGMRVPSGGAALGIPTSAAHRILPVEMAELQFFTGLSIDTSDQTKRRAFIDPDGKPVPPPDAETLLGQKPAVLLHGSGNWIKGINTGPMVPDPTKPPDAPPIPDPTKALRPTGKIDPYSPDPSLSGSQGTSPAPVLATTAA